MGDVLLYALRPFCPLRATRNSQLASLLSHKGGDEIYLLPGQVFELKTNPQLTFPQNFAGDVHLSGFVRQGEHQLDRLTGGKCFAGLNKCAGGTYIEYKTIKIATINDIDCADHARLAGMAPQCDLSFHRVNRVNRFILQLI